MLNKLKKKIFKKTLEERDREDLELFGWKGGMRSYSERLDIDAYLDDQEQQEE